MKKIYRAPSVGVALTLFCCGAILLLANCTPAPYRRGEFSDTYVELPFVRILLNDATTEVNIHGPAQIAIECVRDRKRFTFYSTKYARIKCVDNKLTLVNSNGKKLEDDLEQVTIIPRTRDKVLWVGEVQYRGMVRVLPKDKYLFVINILHVEDYLFGVVPPEIGPTTESDIEAIKAQAVAARTYTLAHLGQFPDKPYDLKADVSDQLYQGMGAEKRYISEACVETRGVVARFNDQFIQGYYHSTCGGHTDCIENVWPKPPQPYLVSVSCSAMCAPSKYTNWSETFSGDALAARVSSYESSLSGKKVTYTRINEFYIDKVEPLCPSDGLRVQRLVIVADSVKLVYEKDRIRWTLGRGQDANRILQSDYFTIADLTRNDDGTIANVTLSGHGYGHGVGLCQMGALGMARMAQSGGPHYTYKDILERYYRGVKLERLY